MRFAHPQVLWLLAVTATLLVTFLWWAWRKKESLAARFIQARLLPQLTVNVSKRREQVRVILLVGAVVCAFLALARPQWGFDWEEVKQRGLDVVVAIDTSRSMLARDVRPDRLTRAKLAALDLLKQTHADRLGLVAFAGTAFLQCPLTLDDEAFRQSVEALDVGIIPQGGTAISAAIDTALTAFKTEGDNFKTLVLITDGEDHDSDALATAERAAKAGMKIFTIGVGTPGGEVLQETNERGQTTNIKDPEGNAVKSRLNEALLQQVASAAGGFYLPLRAANVIETLYEKGLAPLPKSDLASKRVQQFHERYYWPLALAILLLLAELFQGPRRPPRPRAKTPRAQPDPQVPARRAAATLLAALMLTAALEANASPASAARLYQQGRYAEAFKEYERLLGAEGGPKARAEFGQGLKQREAGKDAGAPEAIGRALEKRQEEGDPRLHFNAGAAAYKAGQFEASLPHFARATTQTDLGLQQRAFYNLGNALYRVGESKSDVSEKIKNWEMAEQSYRAAVGLDARDLDARHNRDFVKQKLEELKQQQQKQKEQKQDPNKNQDQDKPDQNQKDQQQKPDQSQKSSQSKDEKQEQPKDQEQQQQPSKPQDSKSQEPQQQNQSGQGGKEEPKPETGSQAEQVPPGQMTVKQAEQLLDAQKGEERALIFLPPQQTNRAGRPFKDW
jgi:Ca-activated chloride channel family protein